MVKNIYSLTPLQEGILFHALNRGENETPYFEQFNFDIKGSFDIEIFKLSWNELIKRHDILRTIFIYDQVSKYKQVVLKKGEIDISYEDISSIKKPKKYIKKFAKEDRERYFNLSEENPLRLKVFKLKSDLYTIVFSKHHILLDGWSVGVLFKEFFQIYSSLIKSEPIKLPPAKPYSSYIKWLNGQDIDTTKRFWSDYLSGYDTATIIPTKDNPQDGYSVAEEKIIIDKEQTTILKKLTQKYSVTLNTLIETLWSVLIAKYNNCEDILFASTVSGRTDEVKGIDEMIGLFINTIPVRVEFNADDSLIDLLKRVMDNSIEAKRHHHYSLAEIQNLTPLKSKLIEQLIVFENYPISNDDSDEIGFEVLNVNDFSQTNYNFLLSVHSLERTEILFQYNSLMFDKQIILNIRDSFSKLISYFINEPKIKISKIDILSKKEVKVFKKFNQTKKEYPKDKSIIELFEEQVLKTPNNVAVIYKDIELTYYELNQKANSLGVYLRESYDVAPDTVIPIIADRGEWMIIAILGVLKSGGVYLPIDPQYPQDRVEYMLKESKAKILLSDNINYNIAINYSNHVIDVEMLESKNSQQNLKIISRGSDLAYIIYTSGSTGEPKGVMVENRSILNTILHQIDDFDIDETSRVLQLSTFSFDVSVSEIFTTLLSGATLITASKDDIVNLNSLIEDKDIDIINITPSLLGSIDKISNLKTLVSGAESAIVKDAIEYSKTTKYINAYGPTEISVDATTYTVNPNKSYRTIPIGKPIFNTKIYILDKSLMQLPLGTIGELYIAGAGLARGYLYQPKLTEERFLNHPKFGRIYKTGDIAKYQFDGNIEYLGRVDDQVKIRGFRVELGEIESAILVYPSIRESVILTYKQNIIAYVVGNKKGLKEYLQNKLPNYMLPTLIIELERLPLTQNDKIDKKALPTPSDIESTKEYIEPKTEVEKELAKIFAEILELKRVGVDDNFFEIGGHSLNAISLIAKIAKSLSIEIKIKELFIYSTVKGLSKLIESKTKIEYSDIEPIEKQSSYEVSNSQRRLWVLDKMQDGSSIYNIAGAIRFKDTIDKKILKKSLKILIDRHEILRTNFREIDGVVRQVINEKPKVIVESVKLKESKLNHYLSSEAKKLFDLESDSLFYAKIVNKKILFVNMHHIISDGWSIDIIIRELSQIYTSLKNRKEPKLEPLKIQYKDYAYWQNSMLKDEKYLQENREYWHNLLDGHQTLNFPTDYARKNNQTFAGEKLNIRFSRELSDKLKRLSRDATLFTTLLTITNILLSQYSNQSDIIVGTPVANREHENLFNQIGFYINTLALRNRVDKNQTFAENLLDVKESSLNAFEHQSYPFDKLIEELKLERDLSQHPIFNIMIILQNNRRSELDFAGSKAEDIEIDSQVSKFDMTFNYIEIDSSVELFINYNSTLFKKSTIDRIILNLEKLIDSIELDKKLNELNIISSTEGRLLDSFNDTDKFYSKDKSIIEIFEEQVKDNPNNIAVVYRDKKITYEQFNKKVNSVANYLIENFDIKPNDIIPIVVDRTEWMSVAMFGVLKAGGAYLPIDSSYLPQSRIDFMLKDSNAKLILTDNSNFGSVKDNSLPSVNIENINSLNQTNPSISREADSLVYIIYTSGSTGVPKGTMITNQNVVNLLQNLENYGFRKRDRIYALTTMNFDMSILELILPFLYDMEVVISDKSEPSEILDDIKNYKIDILKTTPSRYAMFLLSKNAKNLSYTNLLISGGEILTKSMLSKLEKFNKNICNQYGPTEATMNSIYFLSKDLDKNQTSIPIGKPIYNAKAYILDSNINQLPIGAVGELCIGGDGLAKGYLNRDDLTKEKFINHPKLGRIYRTGDIAKYHSDGNIEYLGRIDDQVKIRGFRVELGEIESAILNYSFIKEAVVIAQNQQLVAYIVGDSKELKNSLKYKLPNYMIPSYFIELDRLPLTPNGKIDKKALPKPTDIDRADIYKEPKTKTQKEIAKIFSEVLKIEKIGIEDNFFEIGGHSLNAISIIAKIAKKLHVEIKLKEFFIYSTIEGLSKLVESKTKVEYLDIEPIAKQSSYEVSNSQRRLWVLDKMQDGSSVYNMAGAIEFKKSLDKKILKKSLKILIDRHEILRTNFKEIDGEVRQIVKKTKPITKSIKIKNSMIDNFLEKESKKIFDLENDSLIYIKIINKKILFVNMHHIISDGWSISLIIKELSHIYTALIENSKIELAPLTIQYKDYAFWQNTLLKDKRYLQDNQDYWLTRLKEHKPLDFPTDFARPSRQQFDGEHLSYRFSKKITKRVKSLAKDSTLFTLLLTITNILLSKYSNQDDIILGTPVANRGHEALTNQIGFYINTLALRVKLNQNASLQENLLTITDETLEAFEHQSYPFDKLVDELELERDLSQNPLFNIMIILQNNEQSRLEFSNLKTKEREIDNKTSKFDITFNFIEIKERLRLNIEYNTTLFKKSTIDRVAQNMKTLMSEITLDKKLNELEFISTKERILLDSFNQTKKDYPKDKTIVSLFEEQVKKSPNSIAVVFEDKKLTYKEVDNRANQIANYLINILQNSLESECLHPNSTRLKPSFPSGLKREDIVAIKLERSLEMIIGLMGILKAGCAYLPIDLEYPKDRIEYILADSKAKTTIDLETFKTIDNYSKTNPKIEINSNNLAYIIYTSGSTGKPKGVMLEHRGVVNRLDWMQKEYDLNSDDTILQKTPYSFDVSVWELFLPLIYGVKQVIAKPNGHKDSRYLVELIKKESVTFLHFVPSMLNVMLSSKGLEECSSIKNIVCSGEALSVKIVDDFYSNINHIKLHNLYGPTEASIDVSSFSCNKNIKTVPIGKAIQNIQLYILDSNLNQLPIGAVGELCIGGDGLARGYLNREDLTDVKFINHSKLGRIYKTGDIAKYRSDGNIEYLGRMDDQVKIRGFRIELGEIESAILEYSSIKEAVVLAKNQQLVAYIVNSQKLKVKNEELKDYLKSKLPNYMIPNYFMVIDKIPLTLNGKIDKKALPEYSIEESKKECILPSNENERVLVETFFEVLSTKKISTEDNFFDIGGDSIKAIQITSKLASKGYQLDIGSIFKSNSIKELAFSLTKRVKEINQESIEAKIPLNPIQSWFFELSSPKNHFNQSVLLKMKEDVSKDILDRVIKKLQIHHDMLRVNFRLDDNQITQINHSIDFPIDIEIVNIDNLAKIEPMADKFQSSFDITNSSLMKVILFKIKDKSDRVFILLHHLIVDGVSWRILLEDFNTLYLDYIKGIEPSLPLKTTSFKEYSEKLRDYSKDISDEVEYWREITDREFKLPIDRELEESKKEVSFSLSKEQTKNLLEDISFAYSTEINDILLSALSISIYELFGLKDTLITLEGHGREEILGIDISRTVGWFTSTYPLKLKYQNQDLAYHIKSIKESLREIPNKGIGYGVLKYIGEYELNYTPQILFNYLGEFDNSLNTELFELAKEETGKSISSEFKNEYRLNINAIIIDNEFSLSINYTQFDNELMSNFSNSFKNSLLEIINHCKAQDTTTITPSDISDEDFDIDELNEFLLDFEEGKA